MPDPEQALTVCPVEIGGKYVPPDTLVWILDRSGNSIEVEYRDRRGRIPPAAVVEYPVQGPSLAELRALDPCFGLPDDAFVVEHHSEEHYYEIVRCRAHDRRFLRDVRGGIAMYSALTLLDADEVGEPDDIWARHHGKSLSWLLLEGRTR